MSWGSEASALGDHGEDISRRRRFDELYRTNYPDIFRYLLRRLPADSRSDDAADIAAEVFTTAWRRLEKIPSAPEDRLWLYGVARRTANRQMRGRLRRERLKLRLETEAHTARVGDRTSALMEERVVFALEQLKSADREVVYLVLWDELDSEQAGRVLGCSANAVAIRLHRARARLRAQLSEDVPAPSSVDDNPTTVTREI